MKRMLCKTAVCLGLWATAAAAGPVAEFERAFREVYAGYRMALFATNTGDAAKSAAALDGFAAKWAALMAPRAGDPPPQYADDAEWGATLASVETRLAAAQADVAAGKLPAAHEALEGIRDDIGALHRRNGIATFSDRMNAYHAAMEEVLAVDPATIDAAAVPRLREAAAVLDHLARDIAETPPPEAASPDYAPLSGAFQASVAAFLEATRGGDPDAVRAAMGGLKVPYSKFFLKFG